ncbi:MAG TPA: 23S rRNA pseudouridylate synthase B, partial [Gammaproteobacteria bacterium]|nr:23S rRNA pseudouridylate synthase B [Gammaproteobacteria bacterium]
MSIESTVETDESVQPLTGERLQKVMARAGVASRRQ